MKVIHIDKKTLFETVGYDIIPEDSIEKKHEEELEQFQKYYYSLINNIPGIVYRCNLDKNWTMQYISADVDRISGYNASDFLNNSIRTYESILCPKDSIYVSSTIR